MRLRKTGRGLRTVTHLCVTWAALLPALTAVAANVNIEVTPRETYVGVPVQVQITIENAKSHVPPVLPDIPNTTVRSNGPPSQQTSMSIIGNVTSQSMTLVYSWSVTPKQPGKFTIPRIEVDTDGQNHQTEPVEVVVSRSETGDLLFVELKGSRPSVYVGEQLDVTLQVFIKSFISREFQFTMDSMNMLRRIDFRNSEWGVFQETLEALLNGRGSPSLTNANRKDRNGQEHSYYLFELKRTFSPDRAGQLDVGEVSVVMSYPVRLARGGFGGGFTLAETRPITAAIAASSIVVKPIPTQGRPAIWNGAVGRYRIGASAKPTEVTVGDPITLNLALSGAGKLDTLQPPPLAQIPELTKDFKVPSDPIGGAIEGNTKRFSQSIRANSASVKQIPGIPFAYFDPRTERFVTVRAEPIPLKVKPAQTLSMSQIVESPGTTGKSSALQLTEVSGGILANYSDMDEVLGQRAYHPGWGTAVVLVASPLLFVIALVSRRRSDRLRSDTGLARRRKARKQAVARIHATDSNDARSTAFVVAEALGYYVADRLNLPPGGLTSDEIVQRLNERKVNAEVVRRFEEVLRECEGLRYAGQDGAFGQRLTASAIEAIDAMERERV